MIVSASKSFSVLGCVCVGAVVAGAAEVVGVVIWA